MLWLVIALQIVIPLIAVWWLRREFRSQVSRIVAAGCPMIDMPGQVKELRDKVEAAEAKSQAAVQSANSTNMRVNSLAEKYDRAERIASATPIKQRNGRERF